MIFTVCVSVCMQTPHVTQRRNIKKIVQIEELNTIFGILASYFSVQKYSKSEISYCHMATFLTNELRFDISIH